MSHRWRDFLGDDVTANDRAGLDLSFELALWPSLLDGRKDVELTFLGMLRLTKNDQMMRPRQLSHQRCDFLGAAICLVKLPHSEQIGARVAAYSRIASRERYGEFVDNTVTPLCALKLDANVCAELPVEGDEFRIDGLIRTIARGIDKLDDVRESGVCRDRPRRS